MLFEGKSFPSCCYAGNNGLPRDWNSYYSINARQNSVLSHRPPQVAQLYSTNPHPTQGCLPRLFPAWSFLVLWADRLLGQGFARFAKGIPRLPKKRVLFFLTITRNKRGDSRGPWREGDPK
jgi:hypothetical protein